MIARPFMRIAWSALLRGVRTVRELRCSTEVPALVATNSGTTVLNAPKTSA